MSNFTRHPYHLVDESPWPFLRAFSSFFLTVGLVAWFDTSKIILLTFSLISLLLVSAQWWRDIRNERTFQGLHSNIVELGLRWGIILFIVSEIFFFISFFWCYFHIRLSPRVEVGGKWRPQGIEVLDPLAIPLLNTLVLIVSGISVTWRHHALLEGEHTQVLKGLEYTIILGIIFTFLQGLEYLETSFRIADRVYGSVFFIATGFHGLHVIVGTCFLIVSYFRILKGQITIKHHFGFEARAWYWHFVDVVWLFLYIFVYWWGRF